MFRKYDELCLSCDVLLIAIFSEPTVQVEGHSEEVVSDDEDLSK